MKDDIVKSHKKIEDAIRTLTETITVFSVKQDRMHDELLTHITEDKAIQSEIKKHMEEVEPYLRGAAGLQLVWKALASIGGLILTFYALKQAFNL